MTSQVPPYFVPSPSSISPGRSWNVGREPGTLHGDRLTPRVPTTVKESSIMLSSLVKDHLMCLLFTLTNVFYCL